MVSFVYLLAAIGATGNAPTTNDGSLPTSQSRPDPIPRGNPGNWANTNDYPSVALQREMEGTTGFRVTVSPDGRVTDCTIVSSSGSAELDAATCTNVSRRARFEPALDPQGNPTIGNYANRIRWQIPNTTPVISFPRGPAMLNGSWMRLSREDYPSKALTEKRQGRAKIELSISSGGVVSGCKILETSMHPDLDNEACKIASSRAAFTPALDIQGLPTNGRVQTEVNWRLPGEGASATSLVPTITPIMPKRMLPKAGTSSVSFTVAADGSLVDCTGQTTLETGPITPGSICKMKLRFEPFTDATGKPIARRVTTKTTVQVEDVK
ncbi:energy transducer TonB [Sphingorhabdus sp.]|uniref:energy transducer TonB n=1 Tax=Sphingorhabdus sp. TaxID=1902408 RepID=UPI003983280A